MRLSSGVGPVLLTDLMAFARTRTSKQVKAVIHAAVESKRNGFDPQPEIMVPLVS